jgi:MFS family permease
VRSPVLRLALAVLAGYLALGAGLQVLPADARARFGASAAEVGAVVTAAAVAAVLARPVAGRAADRGAARTVVLAGGTLAALGSVAQLLAPSLPALAAARLLVGAGEGALFTGALAWVLRAAPAERRGRIVGHFGLSMWGGLAAGPPLAAALAAAAGATAVWIAAAILPVAALAGVAKLRAPPGGPASPPHGRATPLDRPSPPPPDRVAPPARRIVARPGLALALAAYGAGTLQAFAVLRLAGTGADLVLGAYGGAFLLVRLLGSPLVDRHRAPRLMAACAALEAAGLAGLAVTGAPHAALPAAALAGAGTALVFPVLATAVADAGGRGAAVGALTSCWDVGLALAGPLGGLAAHAAGLPAPFALAAVAALLAALPLTTVTRIVARTATH